MHDLGRIFFLISLIPQMSYSSIHLEKIEYLVNVRGKVDSSCAGKPTAHQLAPRANNEALVTDSMNSIKFYTLLDYTVIDNKI